MPRLSRVEMPDPDLDGVIAYLTAPKATQSRAMTLAVHQPTGLLMGVRQVLSPHRDERPRGVQPDLIVMHNISLPPDEFGGPWIERLFNGNLPPDQHPYFAEIQGMRVSSHVLIRRDGEILQFVPFHERAWHAGVSTYEGRSACNDFSDRHRAGGHR